MALSPRRLRHVESILARREEFGHFRSDTQRHRAVRGYAREMRRDRVFVNSFAAIGGLAVFGLVWWLLSPLRSTPTAAWITRAAAMMAGLAAFWAFRRGMYRQEAVTYLRQRLSMLNIPVCQKCGYLLEQLPTRAAKCPECGGKIPARMRGIISAIAAARNPK